MTLMTRHLSIASLLLCACLSSTAQDIVTEDFFETPPVVYSLDLRDLQRTYGPSVSQAKVRQRAGVNGTIVTYEDRITNMPRYLHDFINQYVEAAHEVLNGGTNWLSDPVAKAE